MAEERIKRKDLWQKLQNLSAKDWLKASERLNLIVTTPTKGSSHVAIRLPGYENTDVRGLVCTLYSGMRKDVHQIVFKCMLDKKFEEDVIWRALGMLK